MDELNGLRLAEDPDHWRALGFAVDEDGRCALGGVTLQFGPDAERPGIAAWSLPAIDGLAHTDGPDAPAGPAGRMVSAGVKRPLAPASTKLSPALDPTYMAVRPEVKSD